MVGMKNKSYIIIKTFSESVKRVDTSTVVVLRNQKKKKKVFRGLHCDMSCSGGTGFDVSQTCDTITGLHDVCVYFFGGLCRSFIGLSFLRWVRISDFSDVIDRKELHWVQHKLINMCTIFFTFFAIVICVVSCVWSEMPTWN